MSKINKEDLIRMTLTMDSIKIRLSDVQYKKGLIDKSKVYNLPNENDLVLEWIESDKLEFREYMYGAGDDIYYEITVKELITDEWEDDFKEIIEFKQREKARKEELERINKEQQELALYEELKEKYKLREE